MKASRYLRPDRHFEDLPENHLMNDSYDSPDQPAQAPLSDSGVPQAIEVDVGRAMPPPLRQDIPMLQQDATPAPIGAGDVAARRSMIADGIHFVGNALLRGPCSVAGHVDGNLTQASDADVSVVVTETGIVKGDITAHKISVMGRTEGILDSGQGEVSLHDSASVHGLVRYGRIQVNGADLNATLERVAPARRGD